MVISFFQTSHIFLNATNQPSIAIDHSALKNQNQKYSTRCRCEPLPKYIFPCVDPGPFKRIINWFANQVVTKWVRWRYNKHMAEIIILACWSQLSWKYCYLLLKFNAMLTKQITLWITLLVKTAWKLILFVWVYQKLTDRQ